MTSQIRVDEITNRSGLGTVTIYDNGFEFTGVTTFTENVDIEGNLTIGGVLTYEDTTNIDSVGVITARGGIRVTGDSIHVESSEDRLLYLKSTDANAYLTFEDTDSSSGFANRVGTVSDGLYFSTGGGGERVRIDSVGRLLIGRTTQLASSAERLTIDSGMAMFRRNSANAAAVYIRNEDSTADTRHPYLIFADGSGNRGGFGIQNDEASLWISGQQGIAFRTSGSAPSQEERLRITTAGLVGIGTDNPATNLDVNGSLQLRAAGNYTTYATRIYSRLDSTHCTVIESYLNNSTAFEMMGSYADGGGVNPRIVLGSGGQKVGINETAPDRTLHVNSGATDTALKLESTDAEVSLELTDNTGSSYIGGGGSYLNFYSGGNERLRIKSNGQIQLTPEGSTANPNGMFDTSGDNFRLSSKKDGTDAIGLIFQTQASGGSLVERIRIATNGNIGMGGITSPSFTTGGGLHLKRNYGIGFGDGSNGRPDFQLVTTAGGSLDFRCGFGADTADISMTTGGNLVFASGGGIDFSATANSYGSTTSEILDDYEEGTWTPVMNKSGVGGTAGTPSTAVGYYRKVGKLLWIAFYWYKGSGGFGNNAGEWYVSGLPFLLAHGTGGAFQSIPGGYNSINGTNYQTQSNRWQSNNTNGSATLAMYGPNATTNWTSGYAEFAASGCLMVP